MLDSESTRWERAATTKWGAYISDVERRAIMVGHRLSGQPTAALEVGCEGGRWSRMLADAGWQMTCADVNPTALAVCQKRIPEATCILRSPDDRTLPCETSSIGLLLCIEVPPLVNATWFFDEAHRVLKAGGLLVIVYWNLLSLRGLFHKSRAMLAGGLDCYQAPYRLWKLQLIRRGWTPVYEEGFCWFPFWRESDSSLVPLATSFEKFVGLRRLTSISPWVSTVFQKGAATQGSGQ